MKGYGWLLSLVALAAAACGGAQRTDGRLGGDQLAAAMGPGETVVLWCDRVVGEKCTAAAEILEVRPLELEQIQGSEWESVTQTPTECDARGVAELVERLGSALGIQHANWHDTLNDQLQVRQVPTRFADSGCTNCCEDLSETPVHINVVERDGARLYLIRVWEHMRPEFVR